MVIDYCKVDVSFVATFKILRKKKPFQN